MRILVPLAFFVNNRLSIFAKIGVLLSKLFFMYPGYYYGSEYLLHVVSTS